jgi:hypothetical protein
LLSNEAKSKIALVPWDAIGAIAGVLGVVFAVGFWVADRRHKKLSSEVQSVPSPVVEVPPPARLKVKLSQGFLTYEYPRRLSPPMIFVEAANPTSRPYRIDGVGLNVEGTGKIVAITRPESLQPLPVTLHETETYKCWCSPKEIAHELLRNGLSGTLKVRAFVTDTYDHKHLSPPWEFHIDEWAKDKY